MDPLCAPLPPALTGEGTPHLGDRDPTQPGTASSLRSRPQPPLSALWSKGAQSRSVCVCCCQCRWPTSWVDLKRILAVALDFAPSDSRSVIYVLFNEYRIKQGLSRWSDKPKQNSNSKNMAG
jgi:hypothetical protein